MNETQPQMTAGGTIGVTQGTIQQGAAAEGARPTRRGLETGARGWRYLPPQGQRSTQMQAGAQQLPRQQD
ncbi:MAG: hypothetical protein RLW62_19900 [Gammaproteobacteria bacterium]